MRQSEIEIERTRLGGVRRKLSGAGSAALRLDWQPRELPPGAQVALTTLVTHDGAVVRGALYSRGTPRTAVLLTHPRQDVLRSPHIPDFLARGLAVYCQNTRTVGNDSTLIHEQALLDVAAGFEYLRERGFERAVAFGVSGGASLLTYYTEQASRPADRRFDRDPSGHPIDLAGAPMPVPDALVLVAPHPGQGKLLGALLDASLTDENDQLSVDSALDPYNPENGFDPTGSSYPPDFVAAYRAAQLRRAERLDERAWERVEAVRSARRRRKEGGTEADFRASFAAPILVTYRTDADLRTTDLGLEPSERRYGSLISSRPQVSNYGPVGFGRVTTPAAWLSTWSPLSSNAVLARAAAGVSVPVQVIRYTADQSVFDSDIEALIEALPGDDVCLEEIRATHFGEAIDPDAPDGVAQTVGAACAWIGERASWE